MGAICDIRTIHSFNQTPNGYGVKVGNMIHHESLENGKSIMTIDIAQCKKRGLFGSMFFPFFFFLLALKS